ncbi:MAG: hypothetical protein ACI4U2_05190 [Christensenellaceae bacterium]
MQITRTEGIAPYTERDFTFSEKKVQGGRVAKREDALFLISGGRYKRVAEGKERVYVLEGEGYFKWKRGETKYREGDVWLVDAVGEYELNGKGKYLVVFEK